MNLEEAMGVSSMTVRLMAEMGKRGVAPDMIVRLLDSPDALDRLAPVMQSLATVDADELAKMSVINPNVPSERLWECLEASLAVLYRNGDDLARALKLFGTVQTVEAMLGAVCPKDEPWRRAAVCLRFGLGEGAPMEPKAVAERLGVPTVVQWLKGYGARNSFARALKKVLHGLQTADVQDLMWKLPLRELPILALEMEPLHRDILKAAGIVRIGQLEELGREGVSPLLRKVTSGEIQSILDDVTQGAAYQGLVFN